MPLWLFVVADGWAGGACVGPPTVGADVEAALDRALTGFAEGYEDRFHAGWMDANGSVACLESPVAPATAAAFAQVAGLHAFAQGDRDAALAALGNAARLDPAAALPTEIAPEGGPIDRLVASAKSGPPPALIAIDAQGYAVYVDGARMQFRADATPCIVQYVRSDGSVRWTGVVRGAADLPSLEPDASRAPSPIVAAAGAEPRPAPPEVERTWGGPNVPLLASAGGTAAVSGVLLVVGVIGRSAWSTDVETCTTSDCALTPDDLAARRARVNTLGFVGQGGLAVAVGLGVASFTVSF